MKAAGTVVPRRAFTDAGRTQSRPSNLCICYFCRSLCRLRIHASMPPGTRSELPRMARSSGGYQQKFLRPKWIRSLPSQAYTRLGNRNLFLLCPTTRDPCWWKVPNLRPACRWKILESRLQAFKKTDPALPIRKCLMKDGGSLLPRQLVVGTTGAAFGSI